MNELEQEVLSDNDFVQHYEFIEDEQADDEATIRELLGEDDE
jgi:hypothetical protein